MFCMIQDILNCPSSIIYSYGKMRCGMWIEEGVCGGRGGEVTIGKFLLLFIFMFQAILSCLKDSFFVVKIIILMEWVDPPSLRWKFHQFFSCFWLELPLMSHVFVITIWLLLYEKKFNYNMMQQPCHYSPFIVVFVST